MNYIIYGTIPESMISLGKIPKKEVKNTLKTKTRKPRK